MDTLYIIKLFKTCMNGNGNLLEILVIHDTLFFNYLLFRYHLKNDPVLPGLFFKELEGTHIESKGQQSQLKPVISDMGIWSCVIGILLDLDV
jgi:hypothetical protein